MARRRWIVAAAMMLSSGSAAPAQEYPAPDQFAQVIRADMERVRKLARDANIRID